MPARFTLKGLSSDFVLHFNEDERFKREQSDVNLVPYVIYERFNSLSHLLSATMGGTAQLLHISVLLS